MLHVWIWRHTSVCGAGIALPQREIQKRSRTQRPCWRHQPLMHVRSTLGLIQGRRSGERRMAGPWVLEPRPPVLWCLRGGAWFRLLPACHGAWTAFSPRFEVMYRSMSPVPQQVPLQEGNAQEDRRELLRLSPRTLSMCPRVPESNSNH